jgi:hypothetical protein
VTLIGADGEKPEQQSVDDPEILQIHGERCVEARLLRQQLPDKGPEQHEPEPKNHHEARAEKDDPEQ